MTVIPPSGTPQAGGTTSPQEGTGSGSPTPQDGQPESRQQQPQGQPQPQSDTGGSGALTAEQQSELESWLTSHSDNLPGPIGELFRNYRQENRSLRERLRGQQNPQQPQQPQDGQPQVAELQRTVQQQQERLRQGEVRYAVAVASAKLGIVDPEAAYRLLDTDDIDFDDRDRPQNVERLLTELTRERPWLKASTGQRGGADGGAGGRPRPASRTMNDVLREATGRGPRQG